LEIPMKIKIVVHEAEEGGFWAEVPPFLAAPPRATAWKSSCRTFKRQLKDVYPLKSLRRSRAASNG
jgi:hypothetical protein